ncbi:hypothetical protein H8E50_01395 [bacterium]|nr:hypothetical protein [bacterium]
MKYLESKNFDWFETLLTISGTTLPLIRNDVGHIRADYSRKYQDKTYEEISYAVSKELIGKCAIKAAGAGGITSLPATIPGIGIIGTILLGATADMAYIVKLHLGLCYSIAAAYDVAMDDEELKAVSLALLGFTGSTQALKGMSAGVLKKSVDHIAESYLVHGAGKAAAGVTEKLLPRLLRKSYKFIPFLGVPIGASINAVSTIMVGKRARKYFSNWDENSEVEPITEPQIIDVSEIEKNAN